MVLQYFVQRLEIIVQSSDWQGQAEVRKKKIKKLIEPGG